MARHPKDSSLESGTSSLPKLIHQGVGSKLTDKQELFVREYLTDFNGAQAAIRAGYSRRTARTIAQENLTKPDIVNFIQKLMEARSERLEITSDEVLREIRAIAMNKNEKTKDRLKGLELLGRHRKLFTEKIELGISDGLADKLALARKRRDADD